MKSFKSFPQHEVNKVGPTLESFNGLCLGMSNRSAFRRQVTLWETRQNCRLSWRITGGRGVSSEATEDIGVGGLEVNSGVRGVCVI